jgi:hypothetical protein
LGDQGAGIVAGKSFITRCPYFPGKPRKVSREIERRVIRDQQGRKHGVESVAFALTETLRLG